MDAVDFSRIFAPAFPSRARATPDTIHRTTRASADVHDFTHLIAWESEIAAGEVQREQQDGHESAPCARKGSV